MQATYIGSLFSSNRSIYVTQAEDTLHYRASESTPPTRMVETDHPRQVATEEAQTTT